MRKTIDANGFALVVAAFAFAVGLGGCSGDSNPGPADFGVAQDQLTFRDLVPWQDQGVVGDSAPEDGGTSDGGGVADLTSEDGPRADGGATGGQTLWTKFHNGPVDGADVAFAVAVDKQDNIYVGGYITVAAHSRDTWLRKYDPDGKVLWTQTVKGAGTGSMDDVIRGLAHDGANNVIAAGYTQVDGASNDLWVRKYDGSGATVWSKKPGGSGNDVGYAVDTDTLGRPVVAGRRNAKIWAARYQTDGNPLQTGTPAANWVVTDSGERVYGVAFDTTNAVVVAGSVGSAPLTIWVTKYSPSTALVWTKTVSTGDQQEALAVATDSSNAVIAVGYRSGTVAQGQNRWIKKFDKDGGNVWTKNGTADGHDRATAVAVDANDNVIVGGYATVAGQGQDCWLAKYDKDGKVGWARSYNGTANSTDRIQGVAVDSADNVIAVGYTTVAGEAANVWVRKYTP